MKIVCLAPDGSIEQWDFVCSYDEEKPDPTWRIWLYHNDSVCTFNATLPATPEFWGREVLGEL